MIETTYPDVLKVAQQLPPDAQLELAETLLHNLRTLLSGQTIVPAAQELIPLVGLSPVELRTLADAVIVPDHQQQIQLLLEKNRQGSLTSEEETTLDRLLTEADQVALLKARALYTLKVFGLTAPTS